MEAVCGMLMISRFFSLFLALGGISLNPDPPLSPDPFSQNWEKGIAWLEVSLPKYLSLTQMFLYRLPAR